MLYLSAQVFGSCVLFVRGKRRTHANC